MTAAPGPSVEAALRTSRILHAALVGSLVMYAVVAHVLRAAGFPSSALDPAVLGPLRLAFYALGATVAAVVLVLRSRWLTADAAGTSSRPLQARWIACLALAESIGVYGLVLFLLSGNLRDLYVFWIPAVALQLLLAPTREVWEAGARRGHPRSG